MIQRTVFCRAEGGDGIGSAIPDRGFGKRQPGGWTYSILPFLEEQPLWSLGQGVSDVAAKKEQLTRMNEQQSAAFICPARRDVLTTGVKTHWAPRNCNFTKLVGKSDYAISIGDALESDYIGFSGPPNLDHGDDPSFLAWPSGDHYNGVCNLRSEIRLAQVSDGTSKTYLIGDKYLRPGKLSRRGIQQFPDIRHG